MTSPRVIDAVGRYAERFHRVLGDRHSVCSSVGAWLLLAVLSDAATGSDRAELADVLGCDPREAVDAARSMLADPPPAVAAAAALWRDPRVPSRSLDELVGRISPPVEAGAIPSQARADTWARERTLGLIDHFPLDLHDNPLLRPVVVLATALATRIDWQTAFEVVDPSGLVRTPADEQFVGVDLLRVPVGNRGHWQGIVDGRFAAHCASSSDDVFVASVIGGPDDDPADVVGVAQFVAARCASGVPPETTPLADLPLGDGAAWHISKVRGKGRPERFDTVLAAWDATGDHDLLTDASLGFGGAARTLLAMLPPDEYEIAARQSAVAHYTRLGFDAAAVTALGVRAASAVREVSKSRLARLEFTHPYAVVAASGTEGPWQGLPLFAAWVAQPSSATHTDS